jgi:uncharacterized repeat protein (TIGR03803 family)
LYGTAIQYDSPVRGFVFKVDTNGSNYALVHTFGPASNEGAPYAGVTLSGTMLLGTTSDGGISNMGTIFKVNTDGSGYNLLHSFTDSDGASPYSHLALSGSTIYGTAVYGGSAHAGVVFSLSLAPPTILASPQDQTVVSGTTVNINVEATGGPVLGCQWYFNNTNYIGCTTNCFLELSDVQPGQSGAYTVVVTNLFGAATSSPAMLNVIVVAPTILRPPVSQTAVRASDVKFSVAVRGSLPITYQWLLNSERLPDGTNRVLFLSVVRMADVGAYTIVISNLVKVITSAPAMLNAIAPFEKRSVPAIKLTGDPGSLLHLSCADTPGPGAAWQELDTVTLAAAQQYYPVLTLPLPSTRFYRAWQTNVPSVRPALQMSLATELTLTGGIGSNVRLDCINQFGPTDAWVTLDTVALTNTTQPYFDFTMFRQPTRLYRAVPLP